MAVLLFARTCRDHAAADHESGRQLAFEPLELLSAAVGQLGAPLVAPT
jgi:hypothetical protein